MPDVNYLTKVIKDDAFVQQSLLGQDNDLREVLFLGQRLKKSTRRVRRPTCLTCLTRPIRHPLPPLIRWLGRGGCRGGGVGR